MWVCLSGANLETLFGLTKIVISQNAIFRGLYVWVYCCKSVNCIGGGSYVISQNDFRGVKKLIFSDYFSNFALVILFSP